METSLLIFKPDAIQRRLVGQIIARFERKGLKIVAMKMIRVTRELAERHYAEHKGKPFYESLLSYITSAPVIVFALRGQNAVTNCRKMLGATSGSEADPGTIRGDFAVSTQNNLVHASDSLQSAERELNLFFPDELLEYDLIDDPWI